MFISIRDWAKSVGVSRQAGYRAIARCAIPVDASGRVDMEQATSLYRERTRSRAIRSRTSLGDATARGNVASPPTNAPRVERPAHPNGDGSSGVGYWSARIRREEAEAALAEARLGEMSGRLIDRDAVRAEFGRQILAVRDGFLRLPSRLAPVLAGETDQAKVYALLDAEVRHVLMQFTS